MKKYFNTTGLCVDSMHYMVNIDNKLDQIINLINRNSYFVINRPRQYGKTTTLHRLEKVLLEDYLVISISFEGIGDIVFEDEKVFSKVVLELFAHSIEFTHENESKYLIKLSTEVENFKDLSRAITTFVKSLDREVILLIDEVDKSSNNQLFLSFLGMLRNKYLSKVSGKDFTFKSVILAGVYDIKNLKIKIRDDEIRKYNSPWNIAVDFNIDMSFDSNGIKTMLKDYIYDNNLSMDIDTLSKDIYFFTNGYPFLVSRICQIIDERIYEEVRKPWQLEDVYKSVKLLTSEVNTLFESLIKNLENNEELYELTRRILVNGEIIIFNPLDPVIGLGITYGIFTEKDNVVKISNKIFEEIIYNYMISKLRTTTKDMSLYNFKNNFITYQGGLDVEKILQRFQQYMKENYSSIDKDFIEREGRLIFMAFLSPIINGVGFAFKEAQISEEKRLDIVITYNKFKYIIELKIWRGEAYHKEGITQLMNYLDINNMDNGYLVIFNFNKNKEYNNEYISKDGKNLFNVYV